VTGQKAKTVSQEAMSSLVDYPWPGNVRELANTIERLLILSSGDVISLEDLPPNIRFPSGVTGGPASLQEMERLHLIRMLDHTGGKKMQAARLLGIDLKTLNSKIKRYNIPL
jgi:DNA-binding NtrC family response regulator